jgi:ABC-type dipeptide/oligopeptide/nickel transport system ATPase component
MITHNIALVAQMADRIAVMYAGHIVEIGDIYQVFENPLHPYTQGLLGSVPSIQLNDRNELYKMPGEPPNLTFHLQAAVSILAARMLCRFAASWNLLKSHRHPAGRCIVGCIRIILRRKKKR